MLPLKEKMKYIGIIAFLLLGAVIFLFAGIFLPLSLPFSVFVLMGMVVCLTGAFGLGVLARNMWKEYKYHMHNNN